MKNLKSVLFSVLLVCFAFFAVTYTACKKESKRPSCAHLNCINGGACNNGVCVCPTGYTGTYCEQEVPNPCKNVVCQNGGTCVDGSCNCPTGFEGANCEILSATKFLTINNFPATYDFMDSGATGCGTYTGDMIMELSSLDSKTIIIKNLGGFGWSTTVKVTVAGNTLTIPTQSIGGSTTNTISGSGTYDDGVITGSYVNQDFYGSVCTYTFTWTKQ